MLLRLTSTPPVPVTAVVRQNFPGCCYRWVKGEGGLGSMIVIRSTDDNVGEQTEKVSALTRPACPPDSDSGDEVATLQG